MLDIKFIRENPGLIKEACQRRGVKCDIDRLLEVDKKRREALQAIEDMKAQKNKSSKEIGQAKNEQKKKIILQMQELDKGSDRLAKQMKDLDEEYEKIMLEVPNLLLDDVPSGEDEKDNKVIRKWGDPIKFSFKPRDYLALGEKLDLIDTVRAAKVSGARFGYLKREAALLEFAIVQFTFKTLTSKEIIKKISTSIKKDFSDKVFIPIVPPVMLRPDVYIKMARLSEQERDERYYLSKDDIYLAGSAEHTLGPLHMDEVIKEEDLPIRYLGFSTCFRREAGSYGKDTRGILRVHQFDKLEMESFTVPENSALEQDFFVAVQEYLMQALKIPYQVVMMCSGEMGKPDVRQIDIEAWLPSQGKYCETHTSDLMTDYQARRLQTRLKRADGKVEFVHMNDATAFAIGRIIIAILENYQQKDGSVVVPEVLRQYVGMDIIKAR